jgi:rapamycin-insensitive companion of mTOR
LKANHPANFASSDLYKQVMALLEAYRYRLHVRRFILDLFERSVVEEVVREGLIGNTESEEESSTGGGQEDVGGDRSTGVNS